MVCRGEHVDIWRQLVSICQIGVTVRDFYLTSCSYIVIFLDRCHHQLDSPVYNLCLSMLIISYIQICLPCILAAMLIPVFCFCMPCLIRVLARIHETSKVSMSCTYYYRIIL